MVSGEQSRVSCKQCLKETGPGEGVTPALFGEEYCSRHLNPCAEIQLPSTDTANRPFKPFYAYLGVLGVHGSNKDIRVVGIASHDSNFVIVERIYEPTNSASRLSYYHKDSIFVQKLVKAFEE